MSGLKWVRERDPERPHFNQYRFGEYLARVEAGGRLWELSRGDQSFGCWQTLREVKRQVNRWQNGMAYPPGGMGAERKAGT